MVPYRGFGSETQRTVQQARSRLATVLHHANSPPTRNENTTSDRPSSLTPILQVQTPTV